MFGVEDGVGDVFGEGVDEAVGMGVFCELLL